MVKGSEAAVWQRSYKLTSSSPRRNAAWEVYRIRGGPGNDPNVCPEPVGYYSSTAVYNST